MTINSAIPFFPSQPEHFLRRVLNLDAATCIACGVLCSFASGAIASVTDIPAPVLLYAGLSLFPIALFMLLVASRTRPETPLVLLVILGNAAWVLGSLLLLAGPAAVGANAIGVAFVLLQAIAVAALAALEAVGLKRLAALGDSR